MDTSSPLLIDADAERGFPIADIAAVADSRVVILKGAFSQQACLALRESLLAWSAQRGENQADNDNWHYIVEKRDADRVSYFRSYLFHKLDRLGDTRLRERLLGFYRPLHGLICGLNGIDSTAIGDEIDGCAFLPLVFHYPRGSGGFQRHSHPGGAQRFGVIVNLSRLGVDFEYGGTVFEIDGQAMALERIHDCGDIAVFPYSVPHWVTEVDPGGPCDWTDNSGKFTLLMPFYRKDRSGIAYG